MINFNGGTVSLGTSLSPLGMYAGYLLMHSGNYWVAISFLALTITYFVIVIATLCRYIINYRRTRYLLRGGV
jgi:Flp pilus assembly protein TadB